MGKMKLSRTTIIICLIGFFMINCDSALAVDSSTEGTSPASPLRLSLEECLRIALENNAQRKVSMAAIEIAEAQYEQAISSYWPQIKARVAATRLDDDPNFIFPEETSSYTISGLGPVPIQAQVNVPEKTVKLMDRDLVSSSLELVLPIYTGGKRSAIKKQAEVNVTASREAARRTMLEVIYDTKRLYYGALLARNLRKLGEETLERFSLTLDLTERLYKAGSGKVKKTDYLRTKIIVATIRSMLAALRSNEELGKAALINSMGLGWNTQLELADASLPYKPAQARLDRLIACAYKFNPDWKQLELGLEAAEARIKEARSGYFPIVALTGSLTHLDNDYKKGIMSAENRDSWAIGVQMELPLFSGFQTVNQVREARARLRKMKQEEILLREGIALQVKDAFLQMARAQEQAQALKESHEAALENRILNVRAYQNELAETKDVIEAQIMESLIDAQYLTALHDELAGELKLAFIIGSETERVLDE
jgi:outer membrane protein